MIKATKVDGVYSADPVRHPDAEFYPSLSYDRVLREGLAVMDATAVVLCKEQDMPLRVMNINVEGALRRVVRGEAVGTLVTSGEES
jgi:uridylate kinase